MHWLPQTCWIPILSFTHCEWLYIMSYEVVCDSHLYSGWSVGKKTSNMNVTVKVTFCPFSGIFQTWHWSTWLVCYANLKKKSQRCLTIVDKVKQHEPPSSHDDSHCDTLSWLVTLVTSHASLGFDSTLNNSQSLNNKLQRVSAKPSVSLDRGIQCLNMLTCFIKLYNKSLKSLDNIQTPPPNHLTPGGSSLCTLCGYTLLHYAIV